jgi:hypothetical protein
LGVSPCESRTSLGNLIKVVTEQSVMAFLIYKNKPKVNE